MDYSPEVTARFWSKVKMPTSERTGPTGAKECWLWTGYTRTGRNGSGLTYGRFKAKIDGEWKHVTSHRVAYELTKGSVPDGKCVLHKCDVPLCCNPDHLFIGTIDENNKDRAEKGRSSKGVSHPKSKLSEAQVLEIIELSKNGWTQRKLTEHFGIAKGSIQSLLNGQTWGHVTGIPKRKIGSGKGVEHHQAKVTPDQVREIRRLYSEGMNLNQIGLRYNVHRASIRDIVVRKTWQHVE